MRACACACVLARVHLCMRAHAHLCVCMCVACFFLCCSCRLDGEGFNVRWNTPLGATGAADAGTGVGAGAGAGPGRGARGGLLRSSLFSHSPNFIFAKPRKPRSLWIKKNFFFFYVTDIKQRAKTLFTWGEYGKVRYNKLVQLFSDREMDWCRYLQIVKWIDAVIYRSWNGLMQLSTDREMDWCSYRQIVKWIDAVIYRSWNGLMQLSTDREMGWCR